MSSRRGLSSGLPPLQLSTPRSSSAPSTAPAADVSSLGAEVKQALGDTLNGVLTQTTAVHNMNDVVLVVVPLASVL